MSNRLLLSVLAVAVLSAWYFWPETEEIRSGVVLAPRLEVRAGSAFPQVLAFPRVQDDTKTILPPHSPVVVTLVEMESPSEHDEYKSPSAVDVFRKRKGETEKLARERGEQEKEILPTPEEKAAIIATLKEKIDRATTARSIVWNHRDTGISPEDLGTERFEKLVVLAQRQSAEVARDVERSLMKGCPIDAQYWLDMGMNVLRQGLGDRATPEYQQLYQLVELANRSIVLTSEDPILSGANRIAAEDRIRHLKCGMG